MQGSMFQTEAREDSGKMRYDMKRETQRLEVLSCDIYNIGLGQKNTIVQLWTNQRWSFNFRRQFNDGEIVGVSKFFNIVKAFNGRQTGEDVMWWKGNSVGKFKVNSSYRLMDQANPHTQNWSWKQIWRSRIPHKVSCFIWLWATEAASESRLLDEKRDNIML